jgi:ferredoxin
VSLRISIDRNVCVGSENCVRLAAGTFTMDEENIATVVDPTAASEAQIRLAERNCPSGAITIDES